MRDGLGKVSILVWKDLLTEVRTKDLFGGMFIFAVLTIITFNFAFDLSGANRAASGAGAMWVAFNFAGFLGLGRSIALERDRGSLDGLLLCPVDRGTIFMGKFIGNLLFISLVEVISVPIFGALFNLNVFQPALFLVLLLGTVGFAAIGTLLAVMAASTRSREVMLPVLMFPILLPVVIASVRATTLILTDQTRDLAPWLNLLGAYDVLFLAISYLVFERVVEE
ncbi:MAG TPA: heme exporter protein CcmB [Nitrolancea sp.]|nr:heme exporter protein CcmB [Nitrolancea sp.]